MRFDEYRQYDALGLASLVKAKEVSASELLELAMARAEAVNPKINALTLRMADIARTRAETVLQGPFAGVPFLVKDLVQYYAGTPYSDGCPGIKNKAVVSDEHAEITRRWLAAGVVVFGKTNTPEFGMKPITEPLAWGPTRNPWNLARSTGGSSGGSAAAVATGIVPMAGGNDVGGSIRIPSSACGLFGFKPGRGRTPWGPERGEMMHGAAITHVLTRSVRDSAAMLDATHGSELASPFHLLPPARPYLEEVQLPPGKLRIAYSARSPLGTPVCPEIAQAVEETARLLESLGHHVEDKEPPIDWEQLFEDFMRMVYVGCAVLVADTKRLFGVGDDGFEPDTLLLASFGRAVRADEYAQALGRWQDYQSCMNRFYAQYDIYMTPTVALPPPLIGENATPVYEQRFVKLLQKFGMSRALLRSSRLREKELLTMKHIPFTELANLTGVPAMSVPLHQSRDKLPIGIHFMAGPSSEGMLFRLAAQLEQERPWSQRIAPL